MNNENRNEEAVSPVIATILMVAITVVLAGVLYVWASSLADDSTGGGLDTYQFSDRDASGSMSESGGDALVHVAMTQGDDLSWAVLKVSIVIDGGASMNCDEASNADATSQCTYTTVFRNTQYHNVFRIQLAHIVSEITCLCCATWR